MNRASNKAYWRWTSPNGWQLWLHWSCLPAAGAAALAADRRLQRTHPHLPPAQRCVVASIAGCAAVVSVALHEAGHLAAGRALGLEPSVMMVSPLGGATVIPRSAPTPATEAAFVLAGPAASLAVAGIAAAIAGRLPGGSVRTILHLAATTNLLTMAANLLPIPPFDGGVAVRALRWRHTGDREQATRDSEAAGRVTGAALMLFGVVTQKGWRRWAGLSVGLAALIGGNVGLRSIAGLFGVAEQ